MKDEELFKAWKSEQYKDQSTEERLEFVEHLHNFPKHFETTFLAGLKAGRPQWHDLRKGPNDLPKKEGCYLVCMEFNYRHTYILNYGQDDYDDEEKMDWYDDESTHYPKEVIAWCEIPTFDKE